MKKLILALVVLFSLTANAAVPLSAIRTQDVNSICNTKTGTIRNVSEATKKQVYKNAGIAYGDKHYCNAKPFAYEIDHRISLELGATNNISNLQLQAYCTKDELSKDFPANVLYDARAKDKEENRLHKEICLGHITPKDAQEQIYNWKNK